MSFLIVQLTPAASTKKPRETLLPFAPIKREDDECSHFSSNAHPESEEREDRRLVLKTVVDVVVVIDVDVVPATTRSAMNNNDK